MKKAEIIEFLGDSNNKEFIIEHLSTDIKEDIFLEIHKKTIKEDVMSYIMENCDIEGSDNYLLMDVNLRKMTFKAIDLLQDNRAHSDAYMESIEDAVNFFKQ